MKRYGHVASGVRGGSCFQPLPAQVFKDIGHLRELAVLNLSHNLIADIPERALAKASKTMKVRCAISHGVGTRALTMDSLLPAAQALILNNNRIERPLNVLHLTVRAIWALAGLRIVSHVSHMQSTELEHTHFVA